MEKYLLSFEVDKDSEQLFIHGDPIGLEKFANTLLKLAQDARAGDFPHDHFFSKEWGGDELSSVKQGKEGKLINHVKIYSWPTKEGAKPYQET